MKKSIGIIGSHAIKIGIAFTILLIISIFNLRVDFSKDGAYSLSPISKNLVKNLDEVMVVKLISSPELPAELTTLQRYAEDLLAEFQRSGGTKFRYEHIKPASRDELVQMAQTSGLRPIQFRIYENDQMTSKEVVFGMVFEYLGRTESMNLLPRITPKLEYEMTMRIQSLVTDDLPKVAVFRDSTYFDFNTRIFERGIRANFNVVPADLARPIENVDALLFTGSSRNLPEEYLYNLDQYIMKGGKVVFLQDKVDTDGSALYPLDTNLLHMLEHYGFSLSEDVLLDMYSDKRQMGIGNIASFPMYPIMRGTQHPISKDMDNIVLYLASGITMSNPDKLNYEIILKSSANSGWMLAPEFKINQDLFYNPELEDFSASNITTAVLASGSLSSYFGDHEFAREDPGFTSQTDDAQIALFADKELVIDPDNQAYNERSDVILNTLDYLTDRGSMIRIRNRHLSTPMLNVSGFMERHNIIWGDLEKIEKRIKTIAKVVAIVVPALLLILLGLWYNFRYKIMLRSRYEKE